VSDWHLRLARRALMQGGIVLHATEGVWGLACDALDARAVRSLLAVKGRAGAKGLIVIGHDAACFEEELCRLDPQTRQRVRDSWPGPVTWVLPNHRFPLWVTGGHDTVAVRVPGHPQARALARSFGGPLVSTSANRAGFPSARTALAARRWLRSLDRAGRAAPIHFLPGETLGRRGPSEIRTLAGERLRGGG
jgi:L-threonylcarbamoyladenylate synthase